MHVEFALVKGYVVQVANDIRLEKLYLGLFSVLSECTQIVSLGACRYSTKINTDDSIVGF